MRFRHLARTGLIALALPAAFAGCMDRDLAQRSVDMLAGPSEVDSLPVLRSPPAVRYPPELYEQRVEGSVTLRIHIDNNGLVVPESTMVIAPSEHAAFDSAAVRGAQHLSFYPAQLNGQPVGVNIQLPIVFRPPEQPPLPGDTLFRRRDTAAERAITP